MSEKLNEKILEAIENDLPNQIGSKLKELLEESEENELFLKEEREDNKRLSIQGVNYRSEISEFEEKVKLLNEIKLENSKLKERDKDIEVEIAKLKLEEAKNSMSNYREMMEIVFRSPVYKTKINECYSTSGHNSQGNYTDETKSYDKDIVSHEE